MGPFRIPTIYGGHGIYGGDEPDPRHFRTHPAIEQQLLDPSSQIWAADNMFLRLRPEYLYPCLGERIIRASDAQVAPDLRNQAARELDSLRKSIRNYFKRTRRPPGRPSKLTTIDREGMAHEHDRLCSFIRDRCPIDPEARVPHDELNRLFRNPVFQNELLSQFPLKQRREPLSWNQFLEETTSLGISERALRFLGLRYGVSHHTIHRAIWPDRPHAGAPDPSSSPSA